MQQPELTDNARRTLEARYLRRDAEDKVIETPGEMFLRVAREIAAQEARYGASKDDIERIAGEFYDAMASGQFLPNSPTLMNAGRKLGLLSACFVLPVEDSIEGIFESVKNTALIQKAGGGTGFSFDRLRPTGDRIASSGGTTSGPLSFWRVFSEASLAIQQGAFRRGANMGMMSTTHPDILKFVTAKEDLSAFENFNISVKVTDEFMRAVRDEPDRRHVVTNPHTGRRYYLPRDLTIGEYELADLIPAEQEPDGEVWAVGQLWELIVRSAWSTAEPGLCFIDRVNADNPTPHVGRIEATNPCGEQPLLDYEACNLGSINVSKFIRDRELDVERFTAMIRLATRFLDDVIDANDYVIPEIDAICTANRKIGLGVMGLADAMFELGIKYDSGEGVEFGSRVAEIMTREAFQASQQLARDRGSFPNWRGSLWDTRHQRPMRNAAVTTIAPTGTLSIIAGCTGGIEPAYALAFYRRILQGQRLLEIDGPFRRHAEREGFWSKELARRLAEGADLSQFPEVDDETRRVFVTAHQVAPSWHVKMQAAFQQFVDGAISKTVNMPHGAPVGQVGEVYLLADNLNCKGITIYREGCRAEQPMSVQREATARPGRADRTCSRCGSPLPDVAGCARCPQCGATLCG